MPERILENGRGETARINLASAGRYVVALHRRTLSAPTVEALHAMAAPLGWTPIQRRPRRFRVTYDIVTPESAKCGDVAESGYMTARGERIEPLTGRETPGVSMTLRDALELFSRGPAVEDAGNWFNEADGRQDYRTGAEERRALHPPRNISAASYDRLSRLLSNV